MFTNHRFASARTLRLVFLSVVLSVLVSGCWETTPDASSQASAPANLLVQPGQQVQEASQNRSIAAVATVQVSGVLMSYGSEMDLWLGIKQADDRVIRLSFATPAEKQASLVLQNKVVKVSGAQLPNFLNWSHIKVQHLQAVSP
jgi:ABC-type Fe3+-hydroxamate transport system substrate-binding protein